MKMKKYLFSFIAFGMLLVAGCSDMNEVHSSYLDDGERVYIGKVDSLKVLPGDGRVKLRFWASDPRSKSVTFYWVPDDDSLSYTIERTSPRDSFEVVIGGEGSSKTIDEGSYTLQVITSDNEGNYSLPVEKNIKVYGDRYRASLINRVVNSTQYNSKENELELLFSGAFNDDDRGVEMKYTDQEGAQKRVKITDSLLTDPVYISGFDHTKGVTYRTMYLPDSLAIDTFYTDFRAVEILSVVNVALNKPATASDIHSPDNSADKAVDGIIGENTSRWVSPASGEHWLEVDLQGEYAISGFNSWTGNAGALSHPTKNFYFQAWIDGEWVNVVEITDNSDPVCGASFPEVTTSRVRYFVPDYTGNRVRLYEIEVYSTIRY